MKANFAWTSRFFETSSRFLWKSEIFETSKCDLSTRQRSCLICICGALKVALCHSCKRAAEEKRSARHATAIGSSYVLTCPSNSEL
jgi:hypothetical protein